MVTVWTPKAITELKRAYEYISQDSLQNARKVVDEITDLASKLPEQPEMYPLINTKKKMTVAGGLLRNFIIEYPIGSPGIISALFVCDIQANRLLTINFLYAREIF